MSALERNPQVPAPNPHKVLGPGKKLRKGFYECNSIQELDTTLNKLLETKQDYLKFNRLKLKKRLFNQTTATKNLITLLKKEFLKD